MYESRLPRKIKKELKKIVYSKKIVFPILAVFYKNLEVFPNFSKKLSVRQRFYRDFFEKVSYYDHLMINKCTVCIYNSKILKFRE